jgi:hypothetical protein
LGIRDLRGSAPRFTEEFARPNLFTRESRRQSRIRFQGEPRTGDRQWSHENLQLGLQFRAISSGLVTTWIFWSALLTPRVDSAMMRRSPLKMGADTGYEGPTVRIFALVGFFVAHPLICPTIGQLDCCPTLTNSGNDCRDRGLGGSTTDCLRSWYRDFAQRSDPANCEPCFDSPRLRGVVGISSKSALGQGHRVS